MPLKILLIVDAQNDFCSRGALAVPGGEEIIPLLNKLMHSNKYDLIIATQDWHPAFHKSFASSHPGKSVFEQIELNGIPQTLWPDHCVQHSSGANFHPELDTSRFDAIFRKGLDLEVDSYSGFYDNARTHETGLREAIERAAQRAGILDRLQIEIDVAGLALDYCVGFTALDARDCGFSVNVIYDASRSIAVESEMSMLNRLREAGIQLVSSRELLPETERQIAVERNPGRDREQQLNP